MPMSKKSCKSKKIFLTLTRYPCSLTELNGKSGIEFIQGTLFVICVLKIPPLSLSGWLAI